MAHQRKPIDNVAYKCNGEAVDNVMNVCYPFTFVEFAHYDIETHEKLELGVVDGVLLFKGKPICYIELEVKRIWKTDNRFPFDSILYFAHKVEKYGYGELPNHEYDSDGYAVENYPCWYKGKKIEGACAGYYGHLPVYHLLISANGRFVAITNMKRISRANPKTIYYNGYPQDGFDCNLDTTDIILTKHIGHYFWAIGNRRKDLLQHLVFDAKDFLKPKY